MEDICIEERKKSFKTQKMQPIVHERERYAALLRKEKKKSLITQKRLKCQDELQESLEELRTTDEVLGKFNKDLADPSVTVVFLLRNNRVKENKMKIIGEALNNPIDDIDLLRAMARTIRKAFSNDNAQNLIEQCVGLGFIPKLEALLDTNSEPLKVDVIWSLANVASISDETVSALLNISVHKKVLTLMKSGSNLLKEQCLWLLANIAGDGVQARDELLKTDIVDQLVAIISKGAIKASVLENTCWTISNLSKGVPAPPFEKMKELLTYFDNLLYVTEDKVISDILWAISFLTENDETYIEPIMDVVNPKRIVQLILSDNEEIRAASVRIVGSVCAVSDIAADDFMQCGCLPALKHIVTSRSSDTSIIREGCWALSNIAAGPTFHIQQLITLDIIKILISLINGSVAYSVKEEAIYAVANACTEGNDMQVWQMVKDGVLTAFVKMLELKEPGIALLVLEAVEKVLQVGDVGECNKVAEEWQAIGGVEKMEALQLHKNEKIYDTVIRVMEKYYQLEELEQNK